MTPPRRAWWVQSPGASGWSIMLLDAPASPEVARMAALARGVVLVAAALHAADLPQLPPQALPEEDGPSPPPAPRHPGRGMPRKNISRKSRERT
jgi:hypothetical protein